MSLDMSRYLDLYVQEAGDHVEALGRLLVALEAGEADAPVHEAFRHAHSVKGMAASMGFSETSRLAHGLEDLLAPVRDGARLEGAAVDLALKAADVLGELVRAAAEGRPESEAGVDVGALAAALAAAAAPTPGGEAPATGAAEADGAEAAEGAAPRAPGRGPERNGGPDAAAESHAGPLRRLRVIVRVARTSKVPGVRGFLVLKRLAAVGAVVRSEPSEAELKAKGLPEGDLEVLLETGARIAKVEEVLGTVAELERVRVEEAEPAVQPAPQAPRPPVRSVRVRTDLLDGVMDGVGELLLVTERLRTLAADEGGGPQPLAEAVDRLTSVAKGLHRRVMATRMMPLATLTDRLPRVVRETARALGKEVRLEVEGADIELDRSVIEEIDAPLTHLVRNCIDHGLEPAEERRALSKGAAARVTFAARRDRDRVVVEIGDDGRGFDPEALKAAAVAAGHVGAEQAEALAPDAALMLACLPGLSTRQSVSEVSGRGVGLDVVRERVEALGGTLEIRSERGRGSTFVLRLPLTVAIQRLLLVRVAGEVLGVPVAKVAHVAEVPAAAVDGRPGRERIPFLDESIPRIDLGRALRLADGGEPPAARPHVIFEAEGRKLAAAAVDGLAGHLEALIKPAAGPLGRLTGVSGTTLLPDGRPLFVLDLASLLRSADIAA